MATRTMQSRKAKVDARDRIDDEKIVKKQTTEIDASSEASKPKKREKKAISEGTNDELQVKTNSSGKSTVKASTKKKATAVKPIASKTDDDLQTFRVKPVLKRRSKSVEASGASKMNIVNEKSVNEPETIPAKKMRVGPGKAVKKQKVVDKLEIVNENSSDEPVKENITEQKATAMKKKSKKGPAVKKGRATKTATAEAVAKKILEASEEDSELDEEQEQEALKLSSKPNIQETNGKKDHDSATEQSEKSVSKKGRGANASAAVTREEAVEEGEAPAVKKGRATKKGTAEAVAKKILEASEEDSELDEKQEQEALKPSSKPKIQETNGKEDHDSATEQSEKSVSKKKRGAKASAAVTQEEVVKEEEAPKPEPKGKLQISNSKSKREMQKPARAPVAKKGRATKATALSTASKQSSNESEDEDSETGEEAASLTSKGPKTLLNNVFTDYGKIDFGIKEKFNFKIATWNVAGLRALMQKNSEYFFQEDADIICLNELKCGSEKEIPAGAKLEGYHAYWNVQKGSGGVGILSKVEPINVSYDLPNSEFDGEKRLITAEYEKFFLVSVYVVNAGRQLKTLDKRLKWNEIFDDHVKKLDKKKPVIIAGDMNVSHQEIDLANPKTNKKNAGFTPEERDGFTNLLSMGFVDTFRHFYPDTTGAYTFWNYITKSRAKNVGWRLDYFVVSQRFLKHVKDNVIRSTVMGSDHCPIVLFLEL